MQPPFRSKQEVIINAPLEAVWSFSMDLTEIPEFHPRVVKVDLLSGKTLREPGASYQCHLSGGKQRCIEKDIEIIPLQKIVTVLPEDTFGISKILIDYRVETTFQSFGKRSTKVEISHYYSTTTLKAKLLNLIAKGKISRETQATLNAAKRHDRGCVPSGIGFIKLVLSDSQDYFFLYFGIADARRTSALVTEWSQNWGHSAKLSC